jgi:hypothetical protein
MLPSFTAAVLAGAGIVAACRPTFHWREVRACFAQGSVVFQAVIFTARAGAGARTSFFAGLNFE